MKLFLASASPRRFELMKTMPFAFEVYVPKFDERAYETALKQGSKRGSKQALTPTELTRELALGKAICAYHELKDRLPDEQILVLSADTIVTMHGEVFGKGENRARSLEMLHKLNGRAHEVISAVWLVGDALDHNLNRKVENLTEDVLGDAPTHASQGDVFVGSAEVSEDPPQLFLRPHSEVPFIKESIVESSKVYFGNSDDALIEWYVDTYKPFDKAGAYGIQDGGALLVEGIEGSYHNIVGLPIRSVYSMLRKYISPNQEQVESIYDVALRWIAPSIRSCRVPRKLRNGDFCFRIEKAKEQLELAKRGGDLDEEKLIGYVNEFLRSLGMRAEENPRVEVVSREQRGNRRISYPKPADGQNPDDIVWIKFSKGKSVRVVSVIGTSRDITFTDYAKENTAAGIINNALGLEWDEDHVLIFRLENIPQHLNRSDIESGIGNYLIANGIPILDYYSHNY